MASVLALYWVVWAGQLELSRCLWCRRCWPAELEQPWVGRPCACNSALLILLVPFVRNGLGGFLSACSVMTLQTGQSTSIKLPPTLWRWRGTCAVALTSICDSREFLQFLERSCGSPAFFMSSLSYLFCSALSCVETPSLEAVCAG